MKVFHLGVSAPIIRCLVKHQERLGARADGFPKREPFPPLTTRMPIGALMQALSDADGFDVIHFHGIDLLATGVPERAADFRALLACARERSKRVMMTRFGRHSSPEHEELHALFVDRVFDTTGVSNGTVIEFPIDLTEIPTPPPLAPPRQGLSILSFEPAEKTDSTRVELERRGLKFSFESVDRATFRDLDSFRAAIQRSHIVVESIASDAFGYIAVEALVRGKAVISGNHDVNSPQAMAPVLDGNEETFLRRLEGLLREPKSLKDLSTRGRRYVENRHDGAVIAAQLLEEYRKG